MGLIGDTFDAVTDSVEGVYNTISGSSDSTSDDSLSDSINDVEDSLNDGASDVGDSVNDGLEQGTDTVFDFAHGGFDAIAGFLNWLAGFGETIRGVGGFIKNNGSLIPVAGDGLHLVGAFISGLGDVIAGFFHGLAGGIYFIEGFFAFVQTLNGWEGAGFLLGVFLIFISGYLVVSAIVSGQFLLISSFAEDMADAAIGFWLGLGLVIWSNTNLLGAGVLAGTGVILLFVAINTDRGTLVVFGIPAALMGFPLLFAALKFGFLVNLLFTAASIFATVYGTEYLENRLSPRISDDRAIAVGEN